MQMNDELRKTIIRGGTAIEIRNMAIATGMITLRRCGLLNAMRGVTTIDEVMRHTVGEETDSEKPAPAAASETGALPAGSTTTAQPAAAAPA
jgi:hypothetical protein